MRSGLRQRWSSRSPRRDLSGTRLSKQVLRRQEEVCEEWDADLHHINLKKNVSLNVIVDIIGLYLTGIRIIAMLRKLIYFRGRRV